MTSNARLSRLLLPLLLVPALGAVPASAYSGQPPADDIVVQVADDEVDADEFADEEDAAAEEDAEAAADADLLQPETPDAVPGADSCELVGGDAAAEAAFEACTNAAVPRERVAMPAVLRSRTFDGGRVRIGGRGKIGQTLFLGAVRAKGGSSRTILGQARRTVTRAGRVRMTITLTKAGAARLARAKGDVTVTLRTTVDVRRGKDRTTSRRIVLRRV